jgi:hypothetical protein
MQGFRMESLCNRRCKFYLDFVASTLNYVSAKCKNFSLAFELIDLITIQKEYYYLTDHEYSLFEAMSLNT